MNDWWTSFLTTLVLLTGITWFLYHVFHKPEVKSGYVEDPESYQIDMQASDESDEDDYSPD